MKRGTIPELRNRTACVVSQRHRFLYLTTAKNASSTLKEELTQQRVGGEAKSRSEVPREVWDDYFTFAFLRDPVDRLLSAYQEVSLRIERGELPARPFADMPDTEERFLRFLAELESDGAWDVHVALQADFVEGRRIDFWGRVETLQEDLRKIYDRLGIGSCPPLPRRRARQPRRYHVARDELAAATLARIEALYREDAELIAAVRPDEHTGNQVEVEITLIDGSEYALRLPRGHPIVGELRSCSAAGAAAATRLLQLPLQGGATALTFAPRHLARLELRDPTGNRRTAAADEAATAEVERAAAEVPAAKVEQVVVVPPAAKVEQTEVVGGGVPPPPAAGPPGSHPWTNVDEGHLGGYVRASPVPGERIPATPNGDNSTWYPRLWRWLVEELGVRSMLDVGCGEGHAAGFFRDAGCEVVGVDGSRQARTESVIPQQHHVHDFVDGPFVPEGSFDLVWSCEFVEHVEQRYTHNFLGAFAASQRYLLLTAAPPGQKGWHHVNCQHREYWIDKLARLAFAPNPELTEKARALAEHGHFSRTGEVFVRSDRRQRPSFVPAAGTRTTPEARQIDPLQPKTMQVAGDADQPYYLFHDIFVHPDGRKIVAVCSYYGDDWNPGDDGVDYDSVELALGDDRVRGRCVRHRLDSWEPCMLLEFAGAEVEAAIRESAVIQCEVHTGPHRQAFELPTAPGPAHAVALSLVVRNENRWIRVFLQYYLDCLRADHVFVYDNGTADREALLEILEPFRREGRVTYIPWDFRWRNRSDRKMIAQPAQEAHSLNRFANCRWLGFFDVDELLRLPGTTLPAFLERYAEAQIDGLSFGLRWYSYRGDADFETVENPPLTYLYARRDPLGRKRQKLFIKGGRTRFARLHWLEEGRRELPIDDTDIFFHHYEQRAQRFAEAKTRPGERDEYMLRFAAHLSSQAPPPRPADLQAWADHIAAAIDAAVAGRSRLSAEVLGVQGMCGTYNRHFYNNLCNFAGCRYLEIGSFHGASTCAALYGNEISALCIDNWSEFGGRRGRFEDAVQRFRGRSSVTVVERDCFDLETSELGPFDVFLYDGAHDHASQYRALQHYAPTLAALAVVVVDDWSRRQVRDATREAIRDCQLDIAFEREVLPDESDTADKDHERGARGWWNGLYIALIRRPG